MDCYSLRLCHLFLCTLPCLPCYSSPHHSYYTMSLAHLVIARLQTRIPNYRSASTIPLFPLSDSPPLSPPTLCFTRLRQGRLKLLLCRLLTPPCTPTETSPLVDLLDCAQFEYQPQHYPLCYGCLTYTHVGHFRLRSRRFLHCLCPGRLQCPVCQLSRPLPCNIPKKKCVFPLYLLIHCH